MMVCICFFFFLLYGDHRDLHVLTHSFPTRRSSDLIMLAHLPQDRSGVYLISFTRDMWVPIPGVGEGKINSAFARGGTPTLTDSVSALLGDRKSTRLNSSH